MGVAKEDDKIAGTDEDFINFARRVVKSATFTWTWVLSLSVFLSAVSLVCERFPFRFKASRCCRCWLAGSWDGLGRVNWGENAPDFRGGSSCFGFGVMLWLGDKEDQSATTEVTFPPRPPRAERMSYLAAGSCRLWSGRSNSLRRTGLTGGVWLFTTGLAGGRDSAALTVLIVGVCGWSRDSSWGINVEEESFATCSTNPDDLLGIASSVGPVTVDAIRMGDDRSSGCVPTSTLGDTIAIGDIGLSTANGVGSVGGGDAELIPPSQAATLLVAAFRSLEASDFFSFSLSFSLESLVVIWILFPSLDAPIGFIKLARSFSLCPTSGVCIWGARTGLSAPKARLEIAESFKGSYLAPFDAGIVIGITVRTSACRWGSIFLVPTCSRSFSSRAASPLSLFHISGRVRTIKGDNVGSGGKSLRDMSDSETDGGEGKVLSLSWPFLSSLGSSSAAIRSKSRTRSLFIVPWSIVNDCLWIRIGRGDSNWASDSLWESDCWVGE